MGNARGVVYIDTMIVLEAHRANCWASLTGRYDIRTVPKVVEEALRGRGHNAGFVPVEASTFERRVNVVEFPYPKLLEVVLEHEQLSFLDDGEKELLAYLAHPEREGEVYNVCTADKAAIRVACELGLKYALVSLEDLLRTTKPRPSLKGQYSRDFFQQRGRNT